MSDDAAGWIDNVDGDRAGGGNPEGETAGRLICVEDNARCSADEASDLEDGLEFLVENFDARDVVAATAVTLWANKGPRYSVDLFDNPEVGVSMETIATLRRFLQGSQGFVIKSQMESSDQSGIQ